MSYLKKNIDRFGENTLWRATYLVYILLSKWVFLMINGRLFYDNLTIIGPTPVTSVRA
jgi:hypothetical protein